MISSRQTQISGPQHLSACRHVATGGGCGACKTRQLAFCSALTLEELADIEAIVSPLETKPGATLFMEGDSASHIYNITSGAVRLYKLLADGRRQIVGFLLPGDFLGLSVRRSYAYGAETIDSASLCRFKTEELRALFQRYPKLEHRLLEMTGDELAAAQDQMMLLGRKTPVEKVASFLLNMIERQGRWGGSRDSIRLPMTRSDIADYLGLTIETVSRTFTRLRKDGVIELPEIHFVRVLDEEKLHDVAEAA